MYCLNTIETVKVDNRNWFQKLIDKIKEFLKLKVEEEETTPIGTPYEIFSADQYKNVIGVFKGTYPSEHSYVPAKDIFNNYLEKFSDGKKNNKLFEHGVIDASDAQFISSILYTKDYDQYGNP